MSEVDDLLQTLEELFPVGSETFRLEFVPDVEVRERDNGETVALGVFRTISWDRDPSSGERMIRDVKEQQVYLGWPALYRDRERVAAYLQALEQALIEIPDGALEELMPADLIHCEVLELRKAKTSEDFAKALRAKKRLGRWLS